MTKLIVSDCCGNSPRNDIEEEMGLCSGCGCHCTYEPITEFASDREDGDNAWLHDPDMGCR